MTVSLAGCLADAALSTRERELVERILARLRAELGSDLLAVWLYGSRARGEADPEQTDPDRRSDVDLMTIVAPRRNARQVAWWACRWSKKKRMRSPPATEASLSASPTSREGGDYQAVTPSQEEAERAGDFLAAVEKMLDA